MQLRSIEIDDEGIETKIQIAAPLWQWIEFSGMTVEEWAEEFGGDVFQFIKWMNSKIGTKP